MVKKLRLLKLEIKKLIKKFMILLSPKQKVFKSVLFWYIE